MSCSGKTPDCPSGALMAGATTLVVQGFTVLLTAMMWASGGSSGGTIVAGIPLESLALAVIGVFEIAGASLLVANYRLGGPMGVAAAAFLIALAGAIPLKGSVTPRQLTAHTILALTSIALVAVGWTCVRGGVSRPAPSRAPPRPPAGAGGAVGAEEAGEKTGAAAGEPLEARGEGEAGEASAEGSP